MMQRQMSLVPLAGGCLGVVLVLGTAVGQGGHANNSVDFDPMGGMDMSGAGMPGTAGAGDGSAPADSSGTAAGGASAMGAMDMSDPAMAASMPGGFHATCTASRCTVIFARTSTGTAHVLGTTARLARVQGTEVTVLIDGRPVRLRPGHALRVGRRRAELVDASSDEFTVTFSRT